ncbi:MAG: amino acid ABC transporter substrate-binding protein [Alphaproteobacteria bacterium]
MVRAIVAAVLIALSSAASAATLEAVRARGALRCGIAEGQPGFSERAAVGTRRGFHVDYCRAVAAAIFGEASAVEFVVLSDQDRFQALAKGDVDLLSRHTVWTMSRDSSLGLSFAVVTYYDGQGILTRQDTGVASAIELSGAPVCVQAGTLAELGLARYFDANNMAHNPILLETWEEAVAAYASGRCGALTADHSTLHAIRSEMDRRRDHVVLPEVITRKPVGLVVRAGDETWRDIVKWVHFALVTAEALGVNSANIDARRDSDDQDTRHLLGLDGTFAASLGLDGDWAAAAITAIGNYGEIFARNLGPDTTLDVQRGLNNLWNRGGIQYAPPIR